MRRLLVVPLALVLLAAPAARASSLDATMTASGGRQRGNVVTVTDVESQGRNLCLVAHGDGTEADPEPVRHDGSPLTWHLPDPRRPASVTLTTAPVRPGGVDVAAEQAAVTLEPVRRGGRTVGWLVRSEPVAYGTLSLRLSLLWPRERCGQDSATYRYRVLSLPV